MTIINQITSFKISGLSFSGTDTQLNYTAGVTAGEGQASKALVLNASSNIISGINSLTMTSLITSNLTVNGTAFNTNILNNLSSLDGVTAGTASASKVLIVNSSRNITNINSLTATSLVSTNLTGTLQTASQPNITTLGTLSSLTSNGNVNIAQHNGTTTGLQLNSILVTATATQINYLSGITLGTASASKVLTVDSSRNISNINSLIASQLTGTLQTASQTNITSIGTLTSLTSNGNVNIAQHNGTTTGLRLNNVLVTSTANELNKLSGALVTTTELNYLNSVILGTASASKVLTVDSSRNINNINSLTATELTGTLQTASQTNITSVGTLNSLTSNGNVNITQHNGTTTGLQLNSILVTATASELNKLSGTTVITAELNKLSGATVTTTEINYNDLTTGPGTAEANKTLVLDSNRDITNIRKIELNGDGDVITIKNSIASGRNSILLDGDSVDWEFGSRNSSNSQLPNHFYVFSNGQFRFSIDSSGNVNITSHNGSTAGLRLGGTLVTATATELNILDGITATTAELNYNDLTIGPGTAEGSKALIVDSNKDITSIRYLTAEQLTGTLQTASQPNITSLGNLTSISLTPTNKIVTSGQVSTNCLWHSTSDRYYGMRQIDTNNFVMLAYSSGGTYNDYITWKAIDPIKLNINGTINTTGLYINSTLITATPSELNILDGVTATTSELNYVDTTIGSATSSKALVVDGNRDITNINNISVSKIALNNTTNYRTPIDCGLTSNDRIIGVYNNISTFYGFGANDDQLKIQTGGTAGFGFYTGSTNSSVGTLRMQITPASTSILQTTASTSTSTGALIVSGGVGIAGALNVGSTLNVTSSINTTSSGTGISQTNNGVTIGLNITGTTGIIGTTTNHNLDLMTNGSSRLTINSSGSISTSNVLSITNATSSTSTTTGALVISGGTGINGNMFIGGVLAIGRTARSSSAWGVTGIQLNTNSSTYTDNSSTSGTVSSVVFNSFARPTLSTSAAISQVTYTNAATLYIDNSPTVSGTAPNLPSITNSYSLWIASGMSLFADTTPSTTSSNGALVVSGGVGIGGDLNTGGTVYGGRLAIPASNWGLTHTSANSSVEIVTYSNGSNNNYIGTYGSHDFGLATNQLSRLIVKSDGKIGINTTVPSSQLEINASDGNCLRLTYNDSDGSPLNYTDFTLASDGDLSINSSGGTINLTNSTATASKTTGALVVTGGVGISGNMFCNGLTVDGITSGNIVAKGSNSSLRMLAHTDNICYIQAGNAAGTTGSSYDLFIGDYGQTTITSARKFIIKGGTGNVGIGNVAPNYPLDVTGIAHVDQLLIGATTDTTRLISALDGVTTVNSDRFISLGVSNSSGNQAEFTFNYQGNNNNNNRLSLGFHTNNLIVNILRSGRVGINTTAPDRNLEINASDGNCLRLTYNDNNGSATNYTDFTLASNGNLTINSSGGTINLTNSTASTSTTTGALVVTGGAGIGGALNINGNCSIGSLSQNNIFFNQSVNTSTPKANYVGSWTSTEYWGFGPNSTSSTSDTIQLQKCDNTGLWTANTLKFKTGCLLIDSKSDTFSTGATPSTWTNENSFLRFTYGRAMSMNYDGNDLTIRWSGGGNYGRDSSGNPIISLGPAAFSIYQTTNIARPLVLGGDSTSTYTSWGTGGVQTNSVATTYTDRSSAGAVANAMIHSYAQATIASLNARTITNSATLYIANSPTAGTNTTITNSYAIWAPSGRVLLGASISDTIRGNSILILNRTNNSPYLRWTDGTTVAETFINSSGVASIGTNTNHDFGFYTNNGSSSQLYLKSDGNVGIGTNTPTSTLDVNGTTKTKSIIVGSNNVTSSTTINGIIAGSTVFGGSGAAIFLDVNITYTSPSGSAPVSVNATIVNININDDRFLVNVRSVTSTGLTFRVSRIDSINASWATGQSIHYQIYF